MRFWETVGETAGRRQLHRTPSAAGARTPSALLLCLLVVLLVACGGSVEDALEGTRSPLPLEQRALLPADAGLDEASFAGEGIFEWVYINETLEGQINDDFQQHYIQGIGSCAAFAAECGSSEPASAGEFFIVFQMTDQGAAERFLDYLESKAGEGSQVRDFPDIAGAKSIFQTGTDPKQLAVYFVDGSLFYGLNLEGDFDPDADISDDVRSAVKAWWQRVVGRPLLEPVEVGE